MDIMSKKQKYIVCCVLIGESIIVCTGSIWILMTCLIGNQLGFGIKCMLLTKDFINILKIQNPEIYNRHTMAMDSCNIFFTKSMLRKESLSKIEHEKMKYTLKCIYSLFMIDIILIIIFIVRNLL